MFSPNQEKILKILGRRTMTVKQITEKFLEDNEIHSADPGNYVATALRQIARKCEYHQLTWTINGSGMGRAGKTVWRSPRK